MLKITRNLRRWTALAGFCAIKSNPRVSIWNFTAILTKIEIIHPARAGARTASELNLTVSGDTLLRRIRYSSVQTNGSVETPRVLGVDDFSFRRGISFGTILVDLEQRKPVDLLPDREAETLKVWLNAYPGVEIISRDRSGSYADGTGRGAPRAVKIADRFHLLQNLTRVNGAICQSVSEFVNVSDAGNK